MRGHLKTGTCRFCSGTCNMAQAEPGEPSWVEETALLTLAVREHCRFSCGLLQGQGGAFTQPLPMRLPPLLFSFMLLVNAGQEDVLYCPLTAPIVPSPLIAAPLVQLFSTLLPIRTAWEASEVRRSAPPKATHPDSPKELSLLFLKAPQGFLRHNQRAATNDQ